MVLKKFIRPTKVVRGFTLEPDHIELINRESARRRLNNDSMTLRQLLDEWAKWVIDHYPILLYDNSKP